MREPAEVKGGAHRRRSPALTQGTSDSLGNTGDPASSWKYVGRPRSVQR
ncbi:hypothetical protein ACK389_22080 [Streptomyces antibioticus]